jgi:predicted aldo/keto reductase-like oxidoreductase
MRTTLTIDNDIADSLKEQARLQGRPFKQVVNDALRRGLSQAAKEDLPVFRVKPFPGGFQPGIDPLKLNQLNDELMVQEFLEKNARIEKAAGIEKNTG